MVEREVSDVDRWGKVRSGKHIGGIDKGYRTLEEEIGECQAEKWSDGVGAVR